MPISGVNTGAVQPLAAAEKVPGAPEVQKPEEKIQSCRLKPAMDEYVRSEPREPDQASQGTKGPEGQKSRDQVWACNTSKVDREIEKLKKKKEYLEQQLITETDEAKRKDLERRLTQVEQELEQKDSDTYRRQHSTFTQLS